MGQHSGQRHSKESLKNDLTKAVYDHAWDRVLIALLRYADVSHHLPKGVGVEALHNAIRHKRLDVAETLVALGVDINGTVIDFGSSFTPLSTAIAYYPDAVDFLLKAGAIVDVRRPSGQTPLFFAAGDGKTDIVKLLLDHGADPNAIDKEGVTALHWGAKAKQLGAIKLLVQHGADPAIEDNNGETAIDVARSYNDRTSVAVMSKAARSQRSR